MKKLLSLLLALAMLLGMTAFAEEEPFDYTGLWVLTGVSTTGVTVDPSALGLDMTMELYEDGSCTLIALGEEEKGAWILIEGGVSVIDEDAVPMNLILNEEGALTVEEEGATMIFTREEYAEPLSGLTVADFNGSWIFVYAETMGQIILAEEAGLAMSITLQDGTGHVEITDAETTEAYDAVCEIEEIEGVGTVMYFLYLDETGAATENGLILLMYEGDELVWLYSDETMEIYYCFERVVEAAE